MQQIRPTTMLPNRDVIKRTAEKELKRENTYNTLIALPICISEITWDLTSSILDQCVAMRIPELKKTSRVIRTLHSNYLHHYENIGISVKKMHDVQVWVDGFLEHTNGASETYSKIRDIVTKHHPNLMGDWVSLVASVYQAYVFAVAILRFTANAEAEFARRIKLPNYGSILPKELHQLPQWLLIVCGDKTIPKEEIEPIIIDLMDTFAELADSLTEPIERTKHRLNCICNRKHGGCLKYAKFSKYGCFASSDCKRLRNYDNKHKPKK